MIKIIEGELTPEKILSREITDYTEYEGTVREIIADVAANGDEAVLRYTRRFDCPELTQLQVSPDEIKAARDRVDPDFIKTLEEARSNIAFFHEKQVKEGFRLEKEDGIVLGQKYTPIARAGLYVPGGTAAYPSTVLMSAVPAKIAGVSKVVMTTPAGRDGKIKDEILAAADICGVDAVFRCGGAQAIAALAYGTETIPAVDKIVGPGNIFVALAKKQVFGKVAIDMIAGPSEILIIADSSADPVFLAADLLSQAEHDRLASAVMITDCRELALQVRSEVEKQLELLPRAEIARASIDSNSRIIITDSIEKAAEVSNEIAPEHLELCVKDPFGLLEKITNAGSIFLGSYSPEPLGDYFAGPNHTLPTGGSAKFSSPLSVDDFVKKSSYIYYTPEALRKKGERIADFAKREGLDAHAESILKRMGE
ncbi:MAG: histidinol dehydrogenase [Clostridia bacterium]|nr:histidinol dehydrogenase [Clostridia bacterium]